MKVPGVGGAKTLRPWSKDPEVAGLIVTSAVLPGSDSHIVPFHSEAVWRGLWRRQHFRP